LIILHQLVEISSKENPLLARGNNAFHGRNAFSVSQWRVQKFYAELIRLSIDETL
jgi:hypothetical protein